MLNRLGIVVGKNRSTEQLFLELFPDFLESEYDSPSDYVQSYINKYLQEKGASNPSTNGKIFEYILAAVCIREGLLPFYMGAKVAFVPNVSYDIMFYSAEKGPICWSVKTSLRERYKQADLEAIALKYVHRKAQCFLITLNLETEKNEASNAKKKIKSGDIIGLDDVIVATDQEFNQLIEQMKKLSFSTAPTVSIIQSTQVITAAKVEAVLTSIKGKTD